jgi:hypothetical protein
MKGFESQLSATISRKQMIRIFQSYYDTKRNEALENLNIYNKQDDLYKQYYRPPTIPDNVKFNNVISYEFNNDKYLHFEDVISGKGENETVLHFCMLLNHKFVKRSPNYAEEFFYDITESKDVYGHFVVHCHGLSAVELCMLLKFLGKEEKGSK